MSGIPSNPLPLNGQRVLDKVHSSMSRPSRPVVREPDPMVSDVLARLGQSDRHRAYLTGSPAQGQQPNTLAEEIDAIADAMIRALPQQEPAKPPTLTERLSAALAGPDASTTEPASRSVADVVLKALSENG